jgi:hypothetical protein
MPDADNQTNPKHLTANELAETGTGVFAVPDPHGEDFGAAKAVVVSGITYSDCVKRAEFTMAFKWIPERLSASIIPCPVKGEGCVKDCGDDFYCLCVKGRCISP